MRGSNTNGDGRAQWRRPGGPEDAVPDWDDDILGDGVNIAARLEGIATAGGICISGSAHDQVRGKVAVEFTDLGEQELKNIARPVRAYAVVRDGLGGWTQAGSTTPRPSPAPRLSIVVLPFANIGGDPEQDYFVDGVTESLTTDLSRISGSFVIGRHTAFTFKSKAVDLKQIGRDLNVRYVLEGSVQRGGNRLRVNAQLIDAETGNHLWAERFDKPITDLFDMQDEIVSRLANTLDAQLIAAEARRAEGVLHPNSMDLYFQGRACWNKGLTPEYMSQARDFFERALTLDPGNIEALVGAAQVDTAVGINFLNKDRVARLAVAEMRLRALAPTRHAGAVWRCPFIGVDRKQTVDRQNDAMRNVPPMKSSSILTSCTSRPKEIAGTEACPCHKMALMLLAKQ
jgi:TolB-like protein